MKIFLKEKIHSDVFKLLQSNYEIIDDLKEINLCEIIISRNLKINANFIDQCSALKLVIIHGSGCDDVDSEYLKLKGIHLANTPGQNALSVAELIVTMMLQLSKQTLLLNNDYKTGKIQEIAPHNYTSHEISYKTFGMIGVGDIALKAAQILKDGFHMNIIGYSRSLTPSKAKDYGIAYCENMDDIFKQADYISIGTSLNNETFHMITQKHLSMMKKTAYLINTSRGAIIKEDDLYNILKNHEIAGAGLDVLENEPVSSQSPILQLDNVIYTPHIGGSSDEALRRVGMMIFDIIQDYSHGENCSHFLF